LLCLLTVTLAAQAPDTVDARAARLHKAAVAAPNPTPATSISRACARAGSMRRSSVGRVGQAGRVVR